MFSVVSWRAVYLSFSVSVTVTHLKLSTSSSVDSGDKLVFSFELADPFIFAWKSVRIMVNSNWLLSRPFQLHIRAEAKCLPCSFCYPFLRLCISARALISACSFLVISCEVGFEIARHGNWTRCWQFVIRWIWMRVVRCYPLRNPLYSFCNWCAKLCIFTACKSVS